MMWRPCLLALAHEPRNFEDPENESLYKEVVREVICDMAMFFAIPWTADLYLIGVMTTQSDE